MRMDLCGQDCRPLLQKLEIGNSYVLTALALIILRVQPRHPHPGALSWQIQTLTQSQIWSELTYHKCPHPDLVANTAQLKVMIQKLRPWNSEACFLQQRPPRTGHHPCYSSEEFKKIRSPAASVSFFQTDNYLWNCYVQLWSQQHTKMGLGWPLAVFRCHSGSRTSNVGGPIGTGQCYTTHNTKCGTIQWNGMGFTMPQWKHLYRQYNHVQALWHVVQLI